MAKRTQWVNFPDADGRVGTVQVTRTDFVDKDVKSVEHMGPVLFARVRFRENKSGSIAHLEVVPDVDNAAYSRTERGQAPGIFSPTQLAMARIAVDGEVRFRIRLAPSGGDEFMFSVEDGNRDSTLNISDTIQTRRKLFFQIIRMSRANKISWFRKDQFRKRFWDTGHKLYLKLQEVSSGKKIPNRVNFHYTHTPSMNWLRNQARPGHDRSKAPYCVPIVFVNKMCAPREVTQMIPHTLTAGFLSAIFGNWVTVTFPTPLFQRCDPAVDSYVNMGWFPTGALAGEDIPPERTRISGTHSIDINMHGKTLGPGQILVVVKLVGSQVNGLSRQNENLLVIATRDWDGKMISSKRQRDTLVHEMGHRIGMVPGGPGVGGDDDLDGQAHYYDHHGHGGPHCHTGTALVGNFATAAAVTPAPACVMFGDDRRSTGEFCAECRESVRKIDVTPKRKPKLRVQF